MGMCLAVAEDSAVGTNGAAAKKVRNERLDKLSCVFIMLKQYHKIGAKEVCLALGTAVS